MKKLFIFICLIFSFFVRVYGYVYEYPTSFEKIQKQLPELENIKCKFRQEKHLKNISKPLISSGNFEFIKNKGVYFYTLEPIISTTDYTNKNYKQINDIVNAISTKKYSKIEKEFNFYYEKKKNIWSLGIKPKKNSGAYDFISSITIEGTDYIQKIEIQQTNGNSTVLWFTK